MSPKEFDRRVQEISYEDALILNSDAWYRYIGTDINEYLIMSNDSMCKTDEVKSIERNLALIGEKYYTPEEIALLWTIDPNGVKYYMDRYHGQEFKRQAYRVINDVEASDDEVNNFFKVYTDGEAWRAYLIRSWNQLVYGKFNKQENNTTLGTLAEIGAGFTGVDIAQDSRDLVYDIKSRLDGDKENDVSTGEIIFDAVCVLPLIGVIKHYDEIIAIFRGSDKIISIKRLAKLDDLKNLSRLTGAADVARSAKKKLDIVDAGFYNRVLNACELSDSYAKKYSVKNIYDNDVLDQILKHEADLTELAEKDLEAFNKTVTKMAEVACNENLEHKLKQIVEQGIESADESIGAAKKYTSWEEMKKAYKEKITKYLKSHKPFNSPNIRKWFQNGGTIEIKTVDGKEVWIYISSEGEKVPYIDRYVCFPDEYLNPIIPVIDIGQFSGDRKKDIKKMLEILSEDYGLNSVPKGYVVHHDIKNGILQLVDERIHEKFTHLGGYSLYK